MPVLVFGIVTIAAVTFFAFQMRDWSLTPDFLWLRRSGAVILDTGRLPDTDIFSWTAFGQPVVSYQWLFMALAAAIERVAGVEGLVAAHVGVAIGLYLLAPLAVAVPRRVPPAFVIVVGGFALAIVTVNFSIRPLIVSTILLLAQYAAIQALRHGRLSFRATVCLLVPAYMLWANAHNGVVLGLGSLGLFAVGDLIERFRVYRFEPADALIEGRPLPVGHYAVLGAAALLASLFNPYGFGLYGHLFEFSAQPLLAQLIDELRSPNFQIVQFRWFLLLIAVWMALLTRARHAFSAADLLHLAAFTAATMLCARFVVWAALFHALILPRAIHQAWTTGPLHPDLRQMLFGAAVATRRVAGLAAVGTVVLLGAIFALTGRTVADPCEDVAPALGAYGTSVVAGERPFMGPDVGSCAIGIRPDVKVFIDTRFDFYGEALTADAINTLRLQPGWKATLETWRIDRLIVEKRWPLAQALAVDPAFAVLYRDDAAIIARPR